MTSHPAQASGNLHAAGAAADHIPTLAFVTDAVAAAGRMEGWFREALAPGNGGIERLVQKACRADEHVCKIRAAFGGLDAPAAIAEPRRRYLLVEADELVQAAVARYLPYVGPDLGGRRLFCATVVTGLERELVLGRQDIDEEAGKGVVPLGATNLAGLFINGQIDPDTL